MKVSKLLVERVAIATVLLFTLGMGVAFAQSAPASANTSTVFCNLINLLYPLPTRVIIAVIAALAAVLQMWSENSNIMTWIKRHQVLFIFAIVLIAGPSALVGLLSTSTSCSFQ